MNLIATLVVLSSVGYCYGQFYLCLPAHTKEHCDSQSVCQATTAIQRPLCNMACSRVNCSMECANDTYSCKQVCGGDRCLLQKCQSSQLCIQECRALTCPTLDCYSPVGCHLVVEFSGSGFTNAVCRNESADCSLVCSRSECDLQSHSKKVSMTCDKANCTGTFNHPMTNGTVACDFGDCIINVPHADSTVVVDCQLNATCTVIKHAMAMVTCNGSGICLVSDTPVPTPSTTVIAPSTSSPVMSTAVMTTSPMPTCANMDPMPAECQQTCSGANAACKQTCLTSGCDLTCDANTATCQQSCTGNQCGKAICSSQNSCQQLCNATSSCENVHCHSPKKCTFIVAENVGRKARLVCEHSDAACNLQCHNSECNLVAKGISTNITCLNSVCEITYDNDAVQGHVECPKGSTCSITRPSTASITCTTGGGCTFHYNSSSTAKLPSFLLAVSMVMLAFMGYN